MEKKGVKLAAQNRKAHHDYYVEEKYEAGIELAGTGSSLSTGCTSPPMKKETSSIRTPSAPAAC